MSKTYRQQVHDRIWDYECTKTDIHNLKRELWELFSETHNRQHKNHHVMVAMEEAYLKLCECEHTLVGALAEYGRELSKDIEENGEEEEEEEVA